MKESGEVTLKNLGQLLSVEFLAAAVAVAVALGVLQSDVSATDSALKGHMNTHADDMNSQHQRNTDQDKAISEIRRSVDLSENNIKHIKDTVSKNEKTLDEVLRLLREQPPKGL